MNTDVLVPEGRCTLHDMIAAEMERHGENGGAIFGHASGGIVLLRAA
ncbi:hypothetical protein BV97_04632 [Novosphingobium resinovorum]|uniref:Uncharacterized protein n=1 Tax=Novosphingobium resinovorum TaxID=158500 RepID=A0A031JNF0_9SPHN|nr:hypothetical protein BV97_04632 [Novosphingobium resinovorum]